MKKIENSAFLGKVYGKWTVIGNGHHGKHPRLKCRCSCGAERLIDRDNLVSGKSTGCRKCSGMTGNSNPNWAGYMHVPANFFYVLRTSARARLIEFNLTIQDVESAWVKCGGKCQLSGLPLKLCSRSNGLTASLDRINPQAGYHPLNIQFVHKDVNLMKNRFSEDYFVNLCKLISKNVAGTACESCAAGG